MKPIWQNRRAGCTGREKETAAIWQRSPMSELVGGDLLDRSNV
jgi:hypothetical protein